MLKSQGFNELSEDALSFILQSDRLRMDEEDILSKVTEWATVNSVSEEEEGGREGGRREGGRALLRPELSPYSIFTSGLKNVLVYVFIVCIYAQCHLCVRVLRCRW